MRAGSIAGCTLNQINAPAGSSLRRRFTARSKDAPRRSTIRFFILRQPNVSPPIEMRATPLGHFPGPNRLGIQPELADAGSEFIWGEG